MTDSLKALVVDDNRDHRRFVYEVEASINGTEVVGAAPNSRTALSRLRQMPVDVVFLDLEMPDVDSIETLKQIHRSYPDVGVIMMSDDSLGHADRIIQALQIGAIDFIPKPSFRDEKTAIPGFRLQLVTLLGLMRGRKSTRSVKRLQQKPVLPDKSNKPVVKPPGEKDDADKINNSTIRTAVKIPVGTGA